MYNCAKCGAATNGLIGKTISDPRNSRYSLLVDLCPSCSSSNDEYSALQNRLYPESNPNREAIDSQAKEARDRKSRYEKSKEEWIAANPPGTPFPDGHS